MFEDALEEIETKLHEAEVHPAAVRTFRYYFEQLTSGAHGVVSEDQISPLDQVHDSDGLDQRPVNPEALSKTALIKLNGGLGTTMGIAGPKALIEVRDGKSFLDLTIAQTLFARRQFQIELPLIFMNSYRTDSQTKEGLASKGFTNRNIPTSFLQSVEPRLDGKTFRPITIPHDPIAEWCPPGHGDLYPSLWHSGLIDQLLSAGFEYAFVSNVDNLGAHPSAHIAQWFAELGSSFAMEVCQRTANDRKGGHLAIRKSDRQIILREGAQVVNGEEAMFQDITKYRYFNTNNIWLNLRSLKDTLDQRQGVMGLPMIVNTKTSTNQDGFEYHFIQLESAMGSAIEIFADAQVLQVPRSRFKPVKTTNDLMLLRSDVYRLAENSELESNRETDPTIDLDTYYYGGIADFDKRVGHEVPSLILSESLKVHGDWTFGPHVEIRGDVVLQDPGHAGYIEPHTVLDHNC